jgi:hypothetical protein
VDLTGLLWNGFSWQIYIKISCRNLHREAVGLASRAENHAMGLARDPRCGSRRHGSLAVVALVFSWFADGLPSIFHFDWVRMSTFLIFGCLLNG